MTGKTEVVSFWNSIHGRTQLSASMSGLPKRKAGYGPLDPGVLLTPYPDCLRCPFHCQAQSCRFACLGFLSEQVTYGSAQEIAAVVIELCQGASHLSPPPGYLKALRAWTQERGALLIFDEIQSGMGRTGQIFRYQAEGVVPDFLLIGKALGNGLHIAGFLTSCQPEKEDSICPCPADRATRCCRAPQPVRCLMSFTRAGCWKTSVRPAPGSRRGWSAAPKSTVRRSWCGARGWPSRWNAPTRASAAAVHQTLRAGGYLCGRAGSGAYVQAALHTDARTGRRGRGRG